MAQSFTKMGIDNGQLTDYTRQMNFNPQLYKLNPENMSIVCTACHEPFNSIQGARCHEQSSHKNHSRGDVGTFGNREAVVLNTYPDGGMRVALFDGCNWNITVIPTREFKPKDVPS